jgi:hypothetical protein
MSEISNFNWTRSRAATYSYFRDGDSRKDSVLSMEKAICCDGC